MDGHPTKGRGARQRLAQSCGLVMGDIDVFEVGSKDVGWEEGDNVGWDVVGTKGVGLSVGCNVGRGVGACVTGLGVGCGVGASVIGCGVGCGVGFFVGSSVPDKLSKLTTVSITALSSFASKVSILPNPLFRNFHDEK